MVKLRGTRSASLAACRFLGGERTYRQGMHAFLQLRGENLMNQPLSIDAIEAGEQVGNDQDPEVAFAPPVVTGMAFVAVAVVDDVKPLR